MNKYLHNRRFIFPAIAIFVLIGLITTLIVTGGKTTAYSVQLNDKEIFIAKDADAVKQQIEKMSAAEAKRIGHDVALAEDITYHRVLVKESELTKPAQIAILLDKTLKMKTAATKIMVNGRPVVYVANQNVAKKLLGELKKQNAKCADNEKIKSVRFIEKVSMAPTNVASSEVMNFKQALNLLQTGDTSPTYYTVKEGDSLWMIARRNDMHVVDLKAANNLTSENLKLNQKLVITASKPFVNVIATVEGKRNEVIPFETKVIVDKSTKYAVREKQKGHDGEKKVAYVLTKKNGSVIEKKILAETIITKPVDQIIVRGRKTSAMIASRGGSRYTGGALLWPILAHITTYFRGGHPGIDLDGDTGDPIRAAAAGVVTFAGRTGGYGLHIYIDHGNGLKTHYAHCSKLLVSEGQHVSKGQVIALVGSTGHSTGSHLHFEVINNGGYVNPLKALK